MGETTKIEWTDKTFNPWIGCTKVGPPCDNCYAEAMMDHRYHKVEWGPHGERKRTSIAYWRQPRIWNSKAAAAGKRERVFCASLADWLDNQAAQEWREELGAVIESTPWLDWLLLTKRIGNWESLAPWRIPPRNVWVGITCGDHSEYVRDWPKLAAIDAVVRFISHEPSLGLLTPSALSTDDRPDWLIMGGESGPNARYMDPDRARATRDVCAGFGVSFFMKQMTGKSPIPDDLMVRQFPTPRRTECVSFSS